MNRLIQEMEQHAVRLSFRRWLNQILWASLILPAGLLILTVVDAIAPIREQPMAFTVAVFFAAMVIWVVFFSLMFNRRARISLRQLANRIEQTHPDLNDRLITLADFSENRPESQFNSMEQRVVREATAQMSQFDWRAQSTQTMERTRNLAFLAIGVGIILILGAFSRPALKTGWWISDVFGGNPTGIVLSEIPQELPRGSDFSLKIAVQRWEPKARIEWKSGGKSYREPILLNASREGQFNFYNLDNPVDFRVQSPSLRTPWISIDVYTPPSLDGTRMEVHPPAYTKLPKELNLAIGDRTVPEGSRLRWTIEDELIQSGELEIAGEVQPFQPFTGTGMATEWIASTSTEFSVSAQNTEGRKAQSPFHRISVIPDEPPLVEFIEPGEDASMEPGSTLPIEIFASDDYGLAEGRLVLSVSGEELPDIPLFPEEEIQEMHWRLLQSLEAADVIDGDVLALYAEIRDNREPEANLSRTDLIFVEIRTEKPPEEQEGQPMEQEELDLRTLIAEQKRLLRETHRLRSLPQSEQDSEKPGIQRDLRSLAGEIRSTLEGLEERLRNAGLLEIVKGFESAVAQAELAADLLADDPGSSIAPQANAMSQLVRIENELRRNFFTREPSQSQSSEGQSSGQQQSTAQSESEEAQQSPTESLQDALNSLNSAIQEQNRINQEYSKQANGTSAQSGDALADRQFDNLKEAQNARESLSGVPDSEESRRSLVEALRRMESAREATANANGSRALREGLRSREALRQAKEAVESALAAASANSLQQAQASAAALAEAQAAAAAQSGAAGPSGMVTDEELQAMETNQRNLQDAYEALLDRMNQESRSLQATDPEVARSLQQSYAEARQQPTANRMERAANALLYGQTGSAARSQEMAAQNLRQMAQNLGEAANQLANDPLRQARQIARQLGNSFNELESYSEDPANAPADRMEALRESTQPLMEQLSTITGDPRFSQLGNAIAATEAMESTEAHGTLRAGVGQAAMALSQWMQAQATAGSLELNRQAAPPPDAYRRQVEAYFRSLAEEPESSP